MNKKCYVVATIKPWNIARFRELSASLPGEWRLISDKNELTVDALSALSPRYIFFPHWSWIVPKDILDRWECVCFHMADVPYGRGGSPLQNLISRGHQQTKLTALKMEESLDTGPVYKKIDLSLRGSAQSIFEEMSHKVYQLINYIIENEPTPVAQSGEACEFKRRTPQQSVMPESGEIADIYDHIRMLDADTYPRAFIQYGEFELELRDAELDASGNLSAKVHLKKRSEENDS